MKLTIERWFYINLDTLYKISGYSDTIIIHFNITMVNNKKQSFWLFFLVICMVSKLFIIQNFLAGIELHFESTLKNMHER